MRDSGRPGSSMAPGSILTRRGSPRRESGKMESPANSLKMTHRLSKSTDPLGVAIHTSLGLSIFIN
jgi:hypothetical protein